MGIPQRFVGAWGLASFETAASDGTVTRPWGDDPVGIIIWSASGHMSAQLGPRDPAKGVYVAYFGTMEAPDAAAGTLVHRVGGASLERLLSDQYRRFRFAGDDELVLNPPPAADGSISSLTWRRLKAL
jgi:hypothetical protein